MRCLVAFLALVVAAGSAHAGGDVGVVVTGPGPLQNDVENHLESWLRAHGHDIVASPMSHDAITTITNCFTIDDVKCARGVVEARSKSDSVVFARIDSAGKDVTLTTYWFVKGHEVISERRVCEQCKGDEWQQLADTMMDTLAASQVDTGKLLVESKPPGLMVMLDNVEVGVTPYDKELPVGRHSVALTHGGVLVAKKDVDIKDGKTKRLIIETDVGGHHSRIGPALLLGSGIALIAGGGIALYYGTQNGKYEYPSATPVGIGLLAAGAGATIGGAILLTQTGRSSAPVAAMSSDSAYIGWVTRF